MDKFIAHILVVDDDDGIRSLVKKYLNENKFLVTTAENAENALEKIKIIKFDLIVLDIMMPGKSGLEFLKENKKKLDTPVILLTAKGEASERVKGLEMGADDYLAKPFSPRELLARIRAVLRRGAPTADVRDDRIVIRDLTIDSRKHEVKINNVVVSLTSTEFKLLHHLASSRGRAFSREQLLNRVVGMGVVVVDRNIDVHIRALRKKLGNHSDMIQTIRGVGYRFVES